MLNILGKIDLPKIDPRPEEFRELLEGKMRGIKQEVNEFYEYEFLDDAAKVKMEGADLEADNKFVAERERTWAGEHHQSVDEWRKGRDKNPATITEMAVTLILHKWLGEDFVIARACSYDDYKYGVDNVLIDKKTGVAVCGFDEVLGFTGDDGGEKKDKKIKDAILNGGSSLKYGATIEDAKLKRRDLRSMPTFCLSLSKKELINLLVDLKSSNTKTENEKNVILKLVASLGNQNEEAKKIASNNFLKKNLEKFAGSLEIIKNIINQ